MRFFRRGREIAPDEIFLDSHNLPSFDRNQMEGRLDYSLSGNVVLLIMLCFGLVSVVFVGQAFRLQVVRGQEFFQHSKNNSLYQADLFADRGVIYDRNGERLVWNEQNPVTNDFALRKYADIPGLGHVLGYVSYPQKDTSGVYYKSTFTGIAGVESTHDESLSGTNGLKTVEVDALGNKKSENVFKKPEAGETLYLSIDADLQQAMYEEIGRVAQAQGYVGGSGVIMDVQSGELITMVSYPEFSSQVMTDGRDEQINEFLNDTRLPFLNRSVQGLYTPGSIVKPFMAVAALSAGIISEWKSIESTGALVIPNPYFPDKPTIFRDWKAHGWTNMREAIAVSSDVYFYSIGGGLFANEGYPAQEGLGIARIEKYMRKFGFGELTHVDIEGEEVGVIPNPEWKKAHFNGEEWLRGNTYHTVIGQYGFQVTPIQVVRSTASIANGGLLLQPRLTMYDGNESVSFEKVGVSEEHIRVAQEGMRMSVEKGTAIGINLPDLHVAGKTGTAEVGTNKDHMNAWVVGYFPYEKPKYAFAVVMEMAPRGTAVGGVGVMRGFFDKVRHRHPEFYPDTN